MKKTLLRITAKTLLVSMVYQLGFPLYSYALTSGPSQPEVQSFEPIGTTEMVDMFTGDFNYNIPLLDIEGYPVNISYHSGVGIEQEASWVGLGWNINPGNISRAVRGLPDDFNGETIDKELNIEDEKNFKVGTGISMGFELGGFDTRLSLGFKNYIQFNNYKGTSIGISTEASISLGYFNAGVGMGVGSQAGADVDLSAGFHIPKTVSTDMGPGGNGSIGTGFNTRTGMKDIAFGVSGTYNNTQMPLSFSGSIPIGLQNYVPVVTNPSSLSSFEFQARIGTELLYTFPNGFLSIQKSTMSFVKDGARSGYGYLYSENAPSTAITDFSRDRDGRYNKTMENLPLSSMTYDVYSISGQGTGGIFRPFRNDIGSIYDPEVKSPKSDITSVLTEAGIGNLVEVGTDISLVDNEANSGPWNRLNFRGNEQNSLYEKAFFKQGGELTYNNQQAAGIFSDAPIYLAENMVTLKGKSGNIGALPSKFGNAHVYNTGSTMDRTTRANLISYLTAEEASITDVAQDAKIRHYDKFGESTSDTAFYKPGAAIVNDRYSAGKADKPQATHISEFTQTLPDGRRYVYGIPAMNNLSREVTFSVNSAGADLETGLVSFGGTDDSKDNNQPKEKFYSSTTTPAYAHSYLLSSVLATDYVDVLGDGPTDDDMGGWVKMNYTLWDNDYRWRTPYEGDKAQYNPGFWSDKQDDKGSYLIGSRQQWHVRAIESKNYVAEFYVSKRTDGRGVTSRIYNGSKYSFDNGDLTSNLSDAGYSYKLDSIRLFNKHDRYINGNNATPIKTVIFEYDYSLCKKIPNSNTPGTSGKLTLKRIYFRYGKSEKNLLSPYVFNYTGANPDYNFADKDRWGNYKDHTKDSKLSNYEFPYTAQDGSNLDVDKAPWNLTEILLPSGGKINVVYESDDYAYIQDKRTMQMFHIEGVGNSTKKDNQSKLYEDLNTVNDYLYFKRVPAKENRNLSMKDNYLEGTDYLYYSFALDISGSGKYEHMKGYAHIDAMDKCSDDTSYCYIKIRKEHPGDHPSLMHPATIYGINNGRCYLQHIIYPGYLNGDEGGVKIGKALLDALGELGSVNQNPIVRLVENKHIGRDIDIDKSFIRLHRPGLTKKGGGIRVKQLTLSDSWKSLTGSSTNVDADYGKNYSYTKIDDRYGLVSSGVASYEPIYGGDENPFRMPVPYTAEGGRLLPKIEFFQETPFGESFFPPPVVGYSNIRVSSVHIEQGRSSQSYEDYEFYTAKDYPIEVDYTDKEAPAPTKHSGLSKKTLEVKVFQGYALRFNDMHGKPKRITNTILKSNGTSVTPEPVSSVYYKYREQDGKLYNKVLALKRNRGTINTYAVDSTTLGVETDFTVDTRERYNRTFKRNISMNLNVVIFGVFPVPIPTMFLPEKEETETFHSMVTTKIVQRYGILESVEKMDHGAVTKTSNVIFDSETGGVLLSKTNNEYNTDIYDLKYPAYWAYEKMGPAYMHVGFEEKSDSLIIESGSLYGKLHLNSKNFFAGDEVLLTYKVGTDNTVYQAKGWIMEDYKFIASGMVPSPYRVTAYPPTQPPAANIKWVALRALQNSSGGSLWPGGLDGGDYVKDVTVRILRSARRNMLDKFVQQTTLAQNPYSSSINDLLGGSSGSTAFTKVLNVGVQEFTELATPYGSIATDTTSWDAAPAGYYHPHMFPVDIDSANKQVLNRYVLGHRGNFRPSTEYIYIDNRTYANNVKTDGAYSIKTHPFWGNVNASASNYTILNTTGAEAPYWKKTRAVTKYDVFGNVLEELDATANRVYPLTGNSWNYGMETSTGKRTAVQYGYNKALPTAVANNVQQRSFFFEGFEDYSMLLPKNLHFLYKNTYYHKTPFAKSYHQTLDMAPAKVRNDRYGQDYRQYAMVNNGDSITSAAAHSGNYSMRFSANRTFTIGGQTRNSEATSLFNLLVNAELFRLDVNRKYVVSFWFKPVSGAASTVLSNIGFAYTNSIMSSSTSYPFVLKTGNVDGWYKAEYITPAMNYMYLTLPSGVYFDDIRMVPIDANMKSYVYDPVSFKLTAQHDENNFTTFYEYDQEGLLVRVKKETDRGIQTVSESRRSNAKQ